MADSSISFDTSAIPALRQHIRRVPLREQIAEGLSHLIASGLLRQGDELPSERELASTLEVSRESLRGALQLLAERGVLEIGHGTNTRVRELPQTAIDLQSTPLRRVYGADDAAVLAARGLLEPHLAGLAAEQVTDEDIERLQRLLDAQAGMVDDPVRFQISDREFHNLIFTAANSPVLAAFAMEAYAHAYFNRREILERYDGVRLAVKDHARIVEALDSRESQRAQKAMAAHIKMIMGLLARLSQDADGGA